MYQAPVLALLLLSVSACGGLYTLVKAERREVASLYTVDPQLAWNRTKAAAFEVWTVNGEQLEALRFFDPVEGGDTLLGYSVDSKLPPFRSDMTALEVQEFVVDTLAIATASPIQASNLRPSSFGHLSGFRFEVSFFNRDGLEMDGLVLGAIHDERLLLILYTGAQLYYFARYRDAVERLLSSIEVISKPAA